jgi:ADP-ribose pyrophosphatase
MLKLIQQLPNLFIGKRVTLKADIVETLNKTSFAYEYITSKNATAVIPITYKLGQKLVVLVKQHRYPVDEVLYELPAGLIEENEDAVEAGKRELQEETGYFADENTVVTKLGSFYSSPGLLTESINIILLDGVHAGESKLEDAELGMEVELLTLEQVAEKIKNGEIKDQKTTLGLLYLLNSK